MGLFDLFDDVFQDISDIAFTPLEVAADVTKAIVHPVAEVAQDIKEGIKDILE